MGITGETPTNSTPAMVMMKDKLLMGVPNQVKQQMYDNPMIPGAPWAQLSQCLTDALRQIHNQRTAASHFTQGCPELTHTDAYRTNEDEDSTNEKTFKNTT